MYISPANRIRTRLYDLTIIKNGKIITTELGLTARQKNEIAAEYRKEGYTVNSEETYSITRNRKQIGNHPANSDKIDPRKTGKFTPAPVEATERKIERDRLRAHNKATEAATRKLNKNGKNVVHIGTNGRDKNSPMHDVWVAAIKKNGYKVTNTRTGKFFYGFQDEVVRYLDQKINKEHYRYEEFEIKFLGK